MTGKMEHALVQFECGMDAGSDNSQWESVRFSTERLFGRSVHGQLPVTESPERPLDK